MKGVVCLTGILVHRSQSGGGDPHPFLTTELVDNCNLDQVRLPFALGVTL